MGTITIKSSSHPVKKYPTIAPCGLDCGLCPRFYTNGPSRCPGCAGKGFFEKHPNCSFITCCVKNKNKEVCSECPDFPCKKFKLPEEYAKAKESSSYPSYRKSFSNLIFIKKYGLTQFLKEQKKRVSLLKQILDQFDDGRSKSYFCQICNSIETQFLSSIIKKVKSTKGFNLLNQKEKTTLLKTTIKEN